MRSQQTFSTIVIGESVVIREGIVRILRAANFYPLISVTRIDELPAEILQPVLALIVHNGNNFDIVLDEIERLRDLHPAVRIAIVADHCRIGEMLAAFRRGARGYFISDTTCDVLIRSAELVMMGQTIFPSPLIAFILDSRNNLPGKLEAGIDSDSKILFTKEDMLAQRLSPREKSILNYLIEGDTNNSMALKMNIAESTVKVHVNSILRKIQVQNRTQAAIWWMNNGSWPDTNEGSSFPAAYARKRRLNFVKRFRDIN
jgi:two-component system nitrate/nitrite response regulator NarL